MKKLFFLVLCSTISPLAALEHDPWFGNVYAFDFLATYVYTHFKRVQGAHPPLKSPSNDHLLKGALGFCPSCDICWDGEVEFASSPRQSFRFRSTALQGRYLLLEDLAGDPASVTIGANIRYTSHKNLKDISCPYHGDVDGEVNLAIGREFCKEQDLHFRFWLYGAFGQANKGSPWLNGIAGLESNYLDCHKLGLFFVVSRGYGNENFIRIDHFSGYGRVRYHYGDIGFRYGCRLGVWGTLRVEYVHRIFAKLCPSESNSAGLTFLTCFSF